MTHLLDTSVITRLTSEVVRSQVGKLVLDHHRVGRASISDLEVAFSARNAAEFDTIIGALEAFELVEIEPRHFRRALQMQRLLVDRGLRGRKVPDLLIAAAAEGHTMTVIHYDRDFDHISTITGQPTTWVVPSGTID
ncbi:MAG: PIN domain-containing protein [Ilumatobacteraceae bacterium]